MTGAPAPRLHAIPPVGTEFHAAAELGPSGGPNRAPRLGGTYQATVWFRVGSP